MSPLEKLIAKKKEMGQQMDPLEQKAKMGNLESLRDEMSGMMKDDLQPKSMVKVAADSPEGLKAGLDKAKDVVEGDANMDMSDDGDKEEDEAIDDDDSKEYNKSQHDMPQAEGHMGISAEDMAHLQRILSQIKK